MLFKTLDVFEYIFILQNFLELVDFKTIDSFGEWKYLSRKKNYV